MPTLNWIGKDKVVNHHMDVPVHVLNRVYSYDESGQHEEDNGSENMIIHGDNLLALKALLPKYEGKIDCIYIDPPYNTGNEGWVYNDNVNDPKIQKWLGEVVGQEGEDFSRHDKWLCMMYPRLRLLSKLLSKNGTLVISIGYQELHNLLNLCREIFSDKQIVPVTVQTSGGKPNGGFNYTQEYLVFVASDEFDPNPIESEMNEYSSPYHGMNLATFDQVQRPNQAYPIFVDAKGKIVGVGKSLQERIDAHEYTGDPSRFVFDYSEAPLGCSTIWPVTQKGDPCVWRLISSRLINDWNDGFIKVVPANNKNNNNKYTIQYLSDGIISKIKSKELTSYRVSDDPEIPTVEVENYKTAGANVPLIWTDKKFYTARGKEEIRQIFGDKNVFNYPKPSELIKHILAYISNEDSIILDSFAGSGTTGQATFNLNMEDGGNRKIIAVEMMDYADTVTAERVKRVINGYGEGKNAVPGTGGSFSFYELGEPIFTGDNINPKIPEETLRQYIFYADTKQDYTYDESDPYLLGVVANCAYYLFYDQNDPQTIDRNKLSEIRTKADAYVIYGDNCVLGEDFMMKHNITFKKLPMDVARI